MSLHKNMSNLNNKKMDNEKIDGITELKKEFQLLCKAIKDETTSRSMLIAYSNSYELVLDKIKIPHKTIELVVSNDFNNNYSWEMYKEDVLNCAEDLDIIVKKQNDKNLHVLKDWDRSVTMDYKYKKTISCTGYSQSEWDSYTIYYKVWNDQTQLLADLLSKLYTHKNDYIVEVNEILDHDHSKSVELFTININDVEFPDNDRIREEIEYYCSDHDIKFQTLVYNLNN